MNCTYHIQNPISMICTASHKCKCQRKLCTECQYEHGVDLKNTIPIKIFRDKVIQKLKDSKFDQTQEITKQRMSFKSLLSQTESMLKKIWEDLQNSIQQIYDMIEMEDKSYLKIINDNINPAELSNTDLERLVQIVEGQQLINWNTQKNSYLQKLERTKNWWDQEVKTFSESLKKEIKEIQSLIQVQQIQQDDFVYEKNEDLYEILTFLKGLDVSIFNVILELLKKEKISDVLGFLLKDDIRKHFNVNNQERQKFINVIRNINEHDFNRNDYSSNKYLNTKMELIKKIRDDKKIIELLKFIVNLTAIDSKFIQCGSNSLNLLVEMKADLKNHNFENIRIKNISFFGSNFEGCNLSGSEFDNVVIIGMNVNGCQLFNCKWKNINTLQLGKFDGHSGYVLSVCFSPDGNTLASGSNDKSICLWDVKTGQKKSKLDGHSHYVWSVCFSPDGNTLASGSSDKSIRLWDVKTGQQKFKLDGHSDMVMSVHFSPDGNTLASGSGGNSIRLWDVKTGQYKFKLNGHSDCVRSVCFSPDGNTLASGSDDKSIRLWDVKTGQKKSKLDGHSHYVRSVCFSPDGNTLASGSDDKSIRLWDVKTGLQKSKLDGHTREVMSVCFSPDGNTLASSSNDNSIRLWDVKTGQQISKLDRHSTNVKSVCFSPDGNTLASGSDDYSICLWNVKTGQQKSKLDGHSNMVMSVCFSPDGNTLASGSGGNTIRLWDVKTGKEIQSSDKSYKDILEQFKTPLFQNNLPESISTNFPILQISQKNKIYSYGALILKGEFVSQSGMDQKTFFTQNGSCILENHVELKQSEI